MQLVGKAVLLVWNSVSGNKMRFFLFFPPCTRGCYIGLTGLNVYRMELRSHCGAGKTKYFDQIVRELNILLPFLD